jgi:hypothetical protein
MEQFLPTARIQLAPHCLQIFLLLVRDSPGDLRQAE